MILVQLSRLLKSREVDNIIVATSRAISDDKLFEELEKNNIEVFRGSLDNVYERFLEASKLFKCEVIIRITGDCPLVMPEIIDRMVETFEKLGVEYLSNTLNPTFPDGLDVEIFSKKALLRLREFELSSDELEHVTLGIYKRPDIFKISSYENSIDLSDRRWTVDYSEDLDFVQRVFKHFKGKEADFDMSDLSELLSMHPELENTKSSEFRNIVLKPKTP
jgi:spore coat polysaccharide biosynthesis protein SpsF